MPQIRVDIVSDVVCPWCVVGYKRLLAALEGMEENVTVDIHWHPFELNPHMAEGGENLREHIMGKYGSTAEQSEQARANLTRLGKGLGFDFNFQPESRIYNTFAAHQLLHWAHQTDAQKGAALHQGLFKAYFTDGKAIDQLDVLADIAANHGFDRAEALQVLTDQPQAQAVREREQFWLNAGVSGVPALIFDEKYLVSGAQESSQLQQVIRKILEEKQQATV